MKRIALIPIAALAICAGALFGTSTASATVLCKNISFPCSSTYGAGTIIKAELEKVEGIWAIAPFDCHQSTMELEVTNPGSATENASGTVKELSLGTCNCNFAQTVLSKGKFSISHATEANGTLSLSEFKVRIAGSGGTGECSGTVECVYGTTVTGDLTVEGGAMAKIKSAGEATIPKISGLSLLCPTNGPVVARYTVLSPEPLYVLAS